MAPKRPSPLEEPPTASSSSEQEAESGDISEQEQEQENQSQAVSDGEDSEDVEDEEEEEETPLVDKKTPIQKPPPTTNPPPQSSSESEADEGSDSEPESDKTQPSPSASDFTIKPIVSKPIDDSIKPKKPTVSATPSNPAAKRPAETEQNGKESRTKKNKVSTGDDEDGVVEEKKSAINRLWSEDDEIVVLKGMIDYKSKKGADPYADMGAFHEFLKKLLHVDVSKNQLTDKIRRLKKKYKTNVEKGENGEDPVFSKPHEHKSFELSKKIWGGGASNGVDDNAKHTNKKARKSSKVNNSMASLKEVEQELALREASKGEPKASQEEFCSMYPRLIESLQSEKGSYLSLPESGNNFVKDGVSLIGSAKAKELEEKWNNLRMDEIGIMVEAEILKGDVAKSIQMSTRSHQGPLLSFSWEWQKLNVDARLRSNVCLPAWGG
ncbi:hypothetical protein F0562_010983 [Nyssa sinensis]|uniref:Glabrous enhancer-binding protein-like DBD domain-containing protein n=1 Tax=Nyssa sinensis TaxID=561372 RepID=A0A5J5A279_9ASTE|nr:hypothetical protein F0562_010983 [Nyssa sinensis]